MPIYEITQSAIRRLSETTFSAAGVRERADLQRLLRSNIDVVSSDTLVVAEEFGEWEDSRRRIDLLGLDSDANLVVIELKRTEDGGHMELQAIRYAAMVSTLTFDKVVDSYGNHLQRIGSEINARTSILEFLDWDEADEDRFAQDVRIVLASAEFSKELTTAVMWLNEHGLDIRCVRLKPYNDNGRLLVDVQQVIPLPEAAAYQVQVREKEQRGRQERAERYRIRRRFWEGLLVRAATSTALHANISPSEHHWVGQVPACGDWASTTSSGRTKARLNCISIEGQTTPKRTSACSIGCSATKMRSRRPSGASCHGSALTESKAAGSLARSASAVGKATNRNGPRSRKP